MNLETIWDDLSFSIEEFCESPLTKQELLNHKSGIAEDIAEIVNSKIFDYNFEEVGHDLFGDDPYAIDNLQSEASYLLRDSKITNSIEKLIEENADQIVSKYNEEENRLENILKGI